MPFSLFSTIIYGHGDGKYQHPNPASEYAGQPEQCPRDEQPRIFLFYGAEFLRVITLVAQIIAAPTQFCTRKGDANEKLLDTHRDDVTSTFVCDDSLRAKSSSQRQRCTGQVWGSRELDRLYKSDPRRLRDRARLWIGFGANGGHRKSGSGLSWGVLE